MRATSGMLEAHTSQGVDEGIILGSVPNHIFSGLASGGMIDNWMTILARCHEPLRPYVLFSN